MVSLSSKVCNVCKRKLARTGNVFAAVKGMQVQLGLKLHGFRRRRYLDKVIAVEALCWDNFCLLDEAEHAARKQSWSRPCPPPRR